MANSVVLVGYVQPRDPEIKYFESGKVKAKFSLPIERGFGENRQTDWFDVEVWGRQAEFVGEWVKRGSQIIVTGQIELNRWTDQTGNQKEYPLIRATDVRFAGHKKDSAPQQQQAAATY